MYLPVGMLESQETTGNDWDDVCGHQGELYRIEYHYFLLPSSLLILRKFGTLSVSSDEVAECRDVRQLPFGQ